MFIPETSEAGRINQNTGYFEYISPDVPRDSATLTPPPFVQKALKENVPLIRFGAGQLPEALTPSKLKADPKYGDITWQELWLQWLRGERDNAPVENHRGNVAIKNLYLEKGDTLALRQVIADQAARDYGMEGLTEGQVTLGGGGKPLLQAIGHKCFNRNDVVLVFPPCWPTSYDMFRPGVRVVDVPSDGSGYPSAQMIRDVLAAYENDGIRVKGIVLNVPQNPTGENYPTPEAREEAMQVIYAHARQTKDFLLINDDPYSKLDFSRPDLNHLQRGHYERALMDDGKMVTVQSVSKILAMPGQQVGWAYSKNASMSGRIEGYLSTAAGKPTAQSAEIALAGLLYGDEYNAYLRNYLRDNVAQIKNAVDDLAPSVVMNDPQASLYGVWDFSAWKNAVIPVDYFNNSQPLPFKTFEDVHKLLVARAGFDAIPLTECHGPGSTAGKDDWGFRISTAADINKVRQALTAISQVASDIGVIPPDKNLAQKARFDERSATPDDKYRL